MTPSVSRDIRPFVTEIVGDEASFDALATEWDALLEGSAQHVYFLRHAWNRSWWRHLAPRGARLHILCCRDANGVLMGLAPLYWRQHRILGVPYLRELGFIGMGIDLKTSEYLDIIARGGHEHAVATEVTAFLRQRHDWDRMWLHQVPSASLILTHLEQTFDGLAICSDCDCAPYIDTSVTWDAYKRLLGRSMRRNVEYYARRLFKKRNCDFRRAASLDEAVAALDALIELHQKRWQRAGQPGSFNDPTLRTLLMDSLTEGFTAGRVRVWTLRIDGTIQGALLGFLDNGVLHYFQKGFNPELASYDLGTALLSLCLRDSFADPAIRVFDFMGGGAPYKELWAHETRTTKTCVVDRANLRTRLHAARARFWQASTTAFRALVPEAVRAARRDFLNNSRARRQARGDRRPQWLVPLMLSSREACAILELQPFLI
jgi:hypothetical protein